MSRFKSRVWWFIFLIATAIGAAFAGKWLFADAACPRLQTALLYTTAVIFTAVLLFYAYFTRNNAFFNVLLTIALAFGVPLLISSFSGPISKYADLKSAFCAGCDQIVVQANELERDGKRSSAEDILRQCLVGNPTDKNANEALSGILFRNAQDTISSASPCTSNISIMLDEAYERTRDPSFQIAIDSERQRYGDKCATPVPPTESPPTIQIINKRLYQGIATLDVKVLQSGNEVTGLTSQDFDLIWKGQLMPITRFEERTSDDPVCIVAVIDNSGSIKPGLNQIRQAISSLNNKRKPEDEFAMVIFGGPEEVRILQSPSTASLNPELITGSGGSTALWDGVLVGLEVAQTCHSEHRYLIVLTDGEDNSSYFDTGDDLESEADAIGKQADAENTAICPVGVNSSSLKKEDPLKILSRGCNYYPASDFDAVASLFETIIGYVRGFYRIEFTFPGGSPTLRVLDNVEVLIDFNQ